MDRWWLGAALSIALAGSVLADSTPAPAPAATPASPDATAARDLSFRSLAETAIKDQLVDPDSAHFKWGRPFIPLVDLRPGIFAKKIIGPMDYACGQVNSRNRMGGYNGFVWFEVAIKDGAVIFSRIDDGDIDVIRQGCPDLGF